jgi:uncharacterized membrane protein YhhN
MTAAAWALFALAALAAVGDWVSVSGRWPAIRRLEWAAKPAVPVLLAGCALVLRTPVPARRDWFVAALAFCLVGDVVLMESSGRLVDDDPLTENRDRLVGFAAGLAAFLAALAAFTVGLRQSGGGGAAWAVAAAVLALAAVVPLRAVLRGLARRRQLALRGPVLVYAVVLVIMAAASVAAGLDGATPPGDAPLAMAGGLLFAVSDTLLAVDRFALPLPRGRLLVHVPYHLALGLLVLSLAGAVVVPHPGPVPGLPGAS